MKQLMPAERIYSQFFQDDQVVLKQKSIFAIFFRMKEPGSQPEDTEKP